MSFSDLLASTVSSAPHVLLESMPRVTTIKFEVLYYIRNRNSEQIAVVRVHLDNSSNKIMESASQQSQFFFICSSHVFQAFTNSGNTINIAFQKNIILYLEKLFCKTRTCRSTAVEHKLRIFVHHYSKSKSQHCTIWADKSTCNTSVANLLFDIENPFLFCMMKNFP